jgi:hypothetical protein
MSAKERYNELSKRDALQEAEILADTVGLSNEEKEHLALGLHLQLTQEKSAVLMSLGDTRYGGSAEFYRAVLADLGFEKVWERKYEAKYGRFNFVDECQYVLVQKERGLILGWGTYTSTDEGNKRHACVNNANVHFQFESLTYPPPTSLPWSGGWEGCDHNTWREAHERGIMPEGVYFQGHLDVREALRFQLKRLREVGEEVQKVLMETARAKYPRLPVEKCKTHHAHAFYYTRDGCWACKYDIPADKKEDEA